MNILQKSLTIAFLAVCIFISGLTVDFVGAQNTAVIKATSQRPNDLLQSRYLRFGRLTYEDGLSNVQVRGITQDKYGFLWFGTAGGLNRYDGSSIKVYRNDPDDPHSLSHNVVRTLLTDRSGVFWVSTWGGGLNQYDSENESFIRYEYNPDDPHSLSNNSLQTIYEDRAGVIWVGTRGGLNKLNRESKQFKRYTHNPDDPHSLSNNIVSSIFEDRAGFLWVGTGDGLDRFDPKTDRFVHYRHDSDDPTSLIYNAVTSIREDRSGHLWVGTTHGLCTFNPDRTEFSRYQHDPEDPRSLSTDGVASIFIDQSGRVWVGTWGGGLNRFDSETGTFTRYKNHPADPYSLSAATVYQVYEDRQGILWMATDGGISILDGRAKLFHHYRAMAGNPTSLSHNNVRAIHAGRAGVVWIGTSGGGLNKFDRQTEKFTHYQNDPADPNSLSSSVASIIVEDREGMIWVGSTGQGLSKFNPVTERFTHYREDTANPRSLSNDIVVSGLEDRTGTLWVGTWKGGLNQFDRKTEQFIRYQHDPADPNTLSDNGAPCLFEDREGVLWVGTMGGLNKFNRETKTFTSYKNVPTDPRSLVNNSVSSIYEDRTGTLWIGTMKGLDKFDRKKEQFTHYTTSNGLPSDSIWGILEDEQGRLWLSTANGLSRFDPRTESFRNYVVSDGLQSNTFLNFHAYSQSRSGEMFFGGSNGFNAFYPDQIVDNLAPPSVLITDFQLANKPVPIGADSVLHKSIIKTDKLELSYRNRVFSFQFAVLNFRAPELNRYKYRMEGFEEGWNEVDRTRRFATYTNLDPGDYVFRVIGSNNDGVWNEEGDSIRITVTPPWWETLWFRVGMVLVAAGLIAGGFRWRVSGIENRRRELEIQVQNMKKIRQLQVEWERILEVSQDMVCIVGMDGCFKYINQAWEKNLGYNNAALLSKKFIGLVHPDDRGRTIREFKSLTAGYQTVDFDNRYIHKDGSIRYLSWMATPLLDEERVYAVGRDITNRKQIEISLQTSREEARHLAGKLITTQEAERARLARELHDDITQRLAFLNIEMDKLAIQDQFLPEPSKNRLRQLGNDIGELSSDIHMISRQLHPSILEELGLVEAIETECRNFTRLKEVPVTLELDGTLKDLSKEICLCIYRILQESLRNIVQHAKATDIQVMLCRKDDTVHFWVKDNGKGFDPASNMKSGGLGMASMAERARLIQGYLYIESRPGEGTVIKLKAPCASKE